MGQAGRAAALPKLPGRMHSSSLCPLSPRSPAAMLTRSIWSLSSFGAAPNFILARVQAAHLTAADAVIVYLCLERSIWAILAVCSILPGATAPWDPSRLYLHDLAACDGTASCWPGCLGRAEKLLDYLIALSSSAVRKVPLASAALAGLGV